MKPDSNEPDGQDKQLSRLRMNVSNWEIHKIVQPAGDHW